MYGHPCKFGGLTVVPCTCRNDSVFLAVYFEVIIHLCNCWPIEYNRITYRLYLLNKSSCIYINIYRPLSLIQSNLRWHFNTNILITYLLYKQCTGTCDSLIQCTNPVLLDTFRMWYLDYINAHAETTKIDTRDSPYLSICIRCYRIWICISGS